MVREQRGNLLRLLRRAGQISLKNFGDGPNVVAGHLGILRLQRPPRVLERALGVDCVDVPVAPRFCFVRIRIEPQHALGDAVRLLRVTDGYEVCGQAVQGRGVGCVQAQRGEVLPHRLPKAIRKANEGPAERQVCCGKIRIEPDRLPRVPLGF